MNSNTICVKKTFPAKYLKYLSYGIHIMKQLYPAEEEYKQKVAEFLKFSEPVNAIIDDIESSLTDENETEVKELKKSLTKKPKRIRNKKPVVNTLTEQIVELANEPTIKRGPTQVDDVEYVIAASDSEGEPEVVKEEVKVEVKKVTKPKKAKVVVEEVKTVVEEAKTVVEEVAKVVVEEVKTAKKKANKKAKTEIDDDPRPTPTWVEPPANISEVETALKIAIPKVVVKEQLDLTMEMELTKEVPKKVSKPRAKKVVEKKPVEVQEPALVVEELTEENEV